MKKSVSTILIWLKTFQKTFSFHVIDEIAYKQKTERIMQLLLLSRACFSMCTPNTIQRCNQTKVEVAFDVRCPRAFLSYNSSIRVYFLLSSQKWTLDEEKKKQNRSNSRNERNSYSDLHTATKQCSCSLLVVGTLTIMTSLIW